MLTTNQMAQISFTPPSDSGPSVPQDSSVREGVSNVYVFKSRLQEYAQKKGIPTPVYETIKEGPSHEPSFRSTVIVNDVRYDSLPGFFNRKAAEQSAAEVALVELAKSGEVDQSLTQPILETGLCKNLLQEYAQKMKYAIPLYQCEKDEAAGRVTLFKCTVDIGGTRYIGAAAKTKKEAEIKAARTALLAIQSSSQGSVGDSPLTVTPCKKRGAETVTAPEKAPKPKKPRPKKRVWKQKQGGKVGHSQGGANSNSKSTQGQAELHGEQTSILTMVQEGNNGQFASGTSSSNNFISPCSSVQQIAAVVGDSGNSSVPDFNQNNNANPGILSRGSSVQQA